MIREIAVKGFFTENCFFFIDDQTRHGFLIDPGAEAEKLLEIIRENHWSIEKILLTHGHFDHTGAVNEIREVLQIPVFAHENSDRFLLDTKMNLSAACNQHVIIRDVQHLRDGDIIRLSADPTFSLRVIYTPGHTPDSVVYYSAREHAAFVGDTIFKGSIGEYRYPGGNIHDLENSIITKIFNLPAETIICSGHSGQTTVGAEKRRYQY